MVNNDHSDDKMNRRNNWKYLSIGLIATLAVGFSFPKAFADTTSSILNIVTDIQSKVNSSVFGLQAIQNNVNTKASQTSVNNVQTTVNAIKAKTDNLPSDPAKQSTLNNIDSRTQSTLEEVGTIDARLPTDPASEANVSTRASQDSLNAITQQYLPLNFDSLKSLGQVTKCNAPLRSHIDLSGCDLSDGSFADSFLVKANLSGALLDGANFEGSNFFNSNLQGAQLKNAGLHNAYLNYADLSNSNLTGADLSGASLSGTNLNLADISGVNFAGCTGTPVGIPHGGTLPTCS